METVTTRELTCIGCPMGCPLISGGDADMVSVKTKEDIPKGKIFACVKALKSVEIPAPVHIGDVLVEDVAGTGVDIVATKNVESA